MEIETTPVELTEYELEQFRIFQKYRELFFKLEQQHCLSLQFGKITLNYAFGELQNIVKEESVWRK